MDTTLYLICFPNGKLYVGITTRTAEARFRGHCQSSEVVGRAIRKYGPVNCRLVVLHRGLSWPDACELERWYIHEFRTRSAQDGYNCTDGGDGVHGFSGESLCKMQAGAARGRAAIPLVRILANQAKAARAAAIARREKPLTEKQLAAMRANQARAAAARRGELCK